MQSPLYVFVLPFSLLVSLSFSLPLVALPLVIPPSVVVRRRALRGEGRVGGTFSRSFQERESQWRRKVPLLQKNDTSTPLSKHPSTISLVYQPVRLGPDLEFVG